MPEFLVVEDVLAIHALQLERFGESVGVRDIALLESAVAQPVTSFGGDILHEDLFAMASADLFSIAKNYAFVDGNKRTALASGLTFPDLNGIAIDHSSSLLYDATLKVAEGLIEKEDLAALLRRLASSKGEA